MKTWWLKKSLQFKLQILVQIVLLVIGIVTQLSIRHMFENDVISHAKDKALVSADGLLNGLNMLMVSQMISKPELRTLLVKKMGATSNILELRVFRNKPVQDQFGPGLPSEQPQDDIDREVLQTANAQSKFNSQGENKSLRVVIPFIARTEFRGTNCLACHLVPEGTVNGGASITVNLHDEFVDLNRKDIYLCGLQIVFQILLYILVGKLIHSVIKPALQLKEDLLVLSAGDFSRDIHHVAGNDEIASIATSAHMVNVELGKLITEVKISALKVAEIAEKVVLISNMTSSGVLAQKEETHIVSESVSQMVVSLNNSVSNSKSAVAVAQQIEERAQRAKEVVATAVLSIHKISGDVISATAMINTLERESSEISSVIQLIADISKQTNLLALNAAIEAARAGEYGRGFAVVADEVRKLATRIEEATIEIQKKIESLRSGVQKVTVVMNAGHEQANESVDQINRTSATLTEIIESISTIHKANEQISSSIEEQSNIATRINSNISNISTVASQTAFSSKNTSDEIERIVESVSGLSKIVAKFKLPVKVESDKDSGNLTAGKDADNFLF
jgi:methyl-accepting chemotaxis protein